MTVHSVGTPGTGKTTGATLLADLAARRGGARVVEILDPKADSRDGLRTPRPPG
ncbi:MAG: hypothetical protein LC798_05505 [Chloroflexi bacterium]|nr:hypothetical protein [Chloroflexota bacterium]